MSPRRPAVTATALLLALIGCEQAIGLDDFRVENTTADSGVSGQGGSGQGGSGGSVTAGQGGTSGATSSGGAGNASSGAMGGTSGSSMGGAAGSATGGSGAGSCDGVPGANPDVVRSCVLAASCSPFVSNISISTCVSLNWQGAFLGTSCIRNVQSCADVELCEGYGFAGEMCEGQSGVRCENNTAIDCDNGYFLKCGVRGGTCDTVDTNFDFTPDQAGCRVKDSCFESSDATHCDGDILYRCLDGVGLGADCSALQAQCVEDASGAACLLVTPSCDSTVPTCEDGAAQSCIGQTLLRWDCDSVGLECNDENASNPTCAAAGCDLNAVESCTESCNGGATATICYGGVPYEVNCTDYGFSRCAMVTGTSVPDYVVCAQ